MPKKLSPRVRFRRAVDNLGNDGREKAARLLGCSRAFVDMLYRAERNPGMRVGAAIERWFQIPMRDWATCGKGEAV